MIVSKLSITDLGSCTGMNIFSNIVTENTTTIITISLIIIKIIIIIIIIMVVNHLTY
jgi:hypothetical protein